MAHRPIEQRQPEWRLWWVGVFVYAADKRKKSTTKRSPIAGPLMEQSWLRQSTTKSTPWGTPPNWNRCVPERRLPEHFTLTWSGRLDVFCLHWYYETHVDTSLRRWRRLLIVTINISRSWTTVVPALGDPRRERPPAVSGHFVHVPTHFNVNLPLISGHLPNADADTHLLVVSTCYNGQCKQMPCFRWSFQPKIAGAHPNLGTTVRSNFRAVVWWPCNEQYVTSSRLMNHVIAANHPLHWLRLFHDINGNVTYSVCSTRDVEEQNDSLFGRTNRDAVPSGRSISRRALVAEPVRQNANCTYDIEAIMESHVAYVEYKHSRTVGLNTPVVMLH